MKWARPRLLLPLLAAPAYLLLDQLRWLPAAIRDRPWPLALIAIAIAASRARVATIAVALMSVMALGWAAHARYRLPPSSAGAGVGAPLPDVTLPDEAGHSIRLRAPDERPLLVIWFRGSWCPYCKKQLAEIAAELPRYSSSDFRVLAVSPDPPEPLIQLKRELALPFPLISDPDRHLVNACELAHCVAITDGHGVVRWGVVSGNWEKDLPARALLQAAYREK